MIHVLFSSSAAGTLRQVLRARGQNVRVVDLTDSLDWGPIGEDDFDAREEWFDSNVPSEPSMWSWLSEHVKSFCDMIAADTDRLIWLAPRSAQEQSSFYWYIKQFGRSDTQVLLADFSLCKSHDEAPLGLGILNVDAMIELLDKAPRSSWDPVRFPVSRWDELSVGDTLLRIVKGSELKNTSENYFDSFLIDRCPIDFTDHLRVIGYTMCDIWDAGHQIDDAFLLWRMRELVQEGELTSDGELRWGKTGRDVRVRRVR